MLRCNEVTRLYSSDAVLQASLRTRVAGRIHLMMCRFCQRYVQELSVISDEVRRMTLSGPEDPEKVDQLLRRMLRDATAPGE